MHLYAKQKRFNFLVSNFSLFSWYIILRRREEFLYRGLKLLLCVACKVFVSVVSKCFCSSRSVRRELDEVVSEVFLVCGQFGLY